MRINRGILGLCAVAPIASGGLYRLAQRSLGQAEGNRLVDIGPSEILVVWITEPMKKFADMNEPFETHEQLAAAVKAAGMEQVWFAVRSHSVLSDGRDVVSKHVFRPGELHFMHRFPTIQEVFRLVKEKKVKVQVIDPDRLAKDPIKAVHDLEEFAK